MMETVEITCSGKISMSRLHNKQDSPAAFTNGSCTRRISLPLRLSLQLATRKKPCGHVCFYLFNFPLTLPSHLNTQHNHKT
ncbi:hypothetical protein RJT34_17798 [Clitoria ternatea]|uniref:Uncharacterized protein n=1 Tax=Clitoria ternatea TaxID=43366 RepID=A0AAN9JAV7_CLITE